MRRISAGAYELDRHLMRCRRRGEPAWVLVARVNSRRRSTAEHLASYFRVTDSVTVARAGRGYSLAGVFDDGLDRAALERRMRAVAGIETLAAWVRFPDDGVTLAVLLETARLELRRAHGTEAAQVMARGPA